MIHRSTVPRGIANHRVAGALLFGLLFSLLLAQASTTAENPARSVAESGVDFALDALHYHGTNLIQHGWTLAPDGTNAILERVQGDTKNRLAVSFVRKPPLIRSEGWVKSPGEADFHSRPYAMLVEAIRVPYFGKAIAATGDIDLNGNYLLADSYDSTDPNYSTSTGSQDYGTGGQYDPAKIKDNGDIATNSSITNATELKIFGRLAVGPEGTATLGPTGAVGSKSWHASGQAGIEPGWFTHGQNAQFKDAPPPFSIGLPIAVVGGNLTISTGDYVQHGNLSLSGSQKLTVTGRARLYVKGNVSVTGASQIEIEPEGSLELFVAGPSATIAGSGVRLTGSPRTFIYWGLRSNQMLSLSAHIPRMTVYAPHAQVTFQSGGTATQDISGSITAKSVTLTGDINLHYDESLATLGPQNWIRGQTTHPPSRPGALRLVAP